MDEKFTFLHNEKFFIKKIPLIFHENLKIFLI